MHAQLEFGLDPIGAFAIRFVDDENVGDFVEPGLHHLHAITRFRHRDDHRGIGEVHDREFSLSDSDRLDNDHVASVSVEQFYDLARGAAESAMAAA